MDRAEAAGRERAYLESLEQVQRIRQFDGEPARFWSAYLAILLSISGADTGIIAVRAGQPSAGWRLLAVSPESLLAGGAAQTLLQSIPRTTAECLEKGVARSEDGARGVLAVRLRTSAGDDGCLAALFLPKLATTDAIERLRRLALVGDVPASYQLARIAAEARTRVEHFAGVLDLMVLLNAEKRFLPAAMTFCNELASRHRCERVSLGWLHKSYVRLQAISRADRFDRKTEAAQRLEAAMEEALDQNSEIVLPSLEAGGPVSRDHRSYIAAHDVTNICSLPLRVEGEPAAVCTCERNALPFSEVELRLLRLSCDQATRRLADLKRSDRWVGARIVDGAREKLGRALGYQHTGAKVLGLLIAALLGVLLLGQAPYRIKAAAALRTDDVAYLTAPYDGHIDTVRVRVGDNVAGGQELVSLDQTELLLREAELVAEQNRYEREMEKARASNALADMRISMALREQAAARLAQVRYQLDQAVTRAPFEGVIVEGDLEERLGSPVRQGDPLLTLARIEKLYAELEVGEADIHEVRDAMEGEVALASRPQESYRIQVSRMEPVAVAREQGNVFIVRGAFRDGVQQWWRPGMSGVARLAVGRRSLLWILSHRTIDFLRLRLWW